MTIIHETITRVAGDTITDVLDPMVAEIPVTLYLNGKRMISIMSTGENIRELAVGFFYLKGLLKSKQAIQSLKITEEASGQCAYLESDETIKKQRDFFELSEESITLDTKNICEQYPLTDRLKEMLDTYQMTLQEILKMMDTFSTQSEVFVKTGGVHSIGLYEKGQPVLFYDDISRYNTYNKLFGGLLLSNIPPAGKMLLTSGRIPSEVMTWIINNGIRCVLSISAPTNGSVQLARKNGVHLMGFVRGSKMNVYA